MGCVACAVVGFGDLPMTLLLVCFAGDTPNDNDTVCDLSRRFIAIAHATEGTLRNKPGKNKNK